MSFEIMPYDKQITDVRRKAVEVTVEILLPELSEENKARLTEWRLYSHNALTE
jgi:hypothetical protein